MDFSELASAYIRRKRVEARILASELGQLISGGVPSTPRPGGPVSARTTRVPAHQMIDEIRTHSRQIRIKGLSEYYARLNQERTNGD